LEVGSWKLEVGSWNSIAGKAVEKLWKSCGKAVEKLWKSCGKAVEKPSSFKNLRSRRSDEEREQLFALVDIAKIITGKDQNHAAEQVRNILKNNPEAFNEI
jgi:hypothetical protein